MERFFRNHGARFQFVYELMPPLVQSALTSMRGLPLTRNRYTTAMKGLCAELRIHESWTKDQIHDLQSRLLQETLDHARRTVPHYRFYPPLKLNHIEDIRALPVLSREEVRADPSEFLSASTPERELILVRTTGTTGASVTIGYSAELMGRAWAFRMRHWEWAGISPREWRITLFGSRVVTPKRKKPPYWTYNLAEHQILLSVFHLSQQSANDYIRFLHRHEHMVLEGFPSVLAILADFALQRGERLPMRAIFTDGEPLYSHMRERIERAFQAKIYDTYGNTELCGLVQECEHSQMHLSPEFGFAEILNDRNEPVTAGEEGYFVWTSLLNRTTPLIRYRIGDRGCWAQDTCPCGRAFPLIRPTITRDSDLLHHPDGRIFSPRALNQLLKVATSLCFCQFVQDAPDHVIVRGVPSHPSASRDLLGIACALRHLLGNGMRVTSEIAAEPITRAGGKIPLIFVAFKVPPQLPDSQ